MEDRKNQPQGGLNEGEGSKTADKQYRQSATEFAKRTDTLQQGREAEREVENYRDEYERAEKSGRRTIGRDDAQGHDGARLPAQVGKMRRNGDRTCIETCEERSDVIQPGG